MDPVEGDMRYKVGVNGNYGDSAIGNLKENGKQKGVEFLRSVRFKEAQAIDDYKKKLENVDSEFYGE